MHLKVTRMVLDHAPRPPRPRRPGWRVSARALTPAVYTTLYRAVGADVQWDDRLRMTPVGRAALLAARRMHVLHLTVGGVLAGFAEFETTAPRRRVLRHFGLLPAARGTGAGRFLLAVALRAVWRPGIAVTLETDGNDHPRAVAVYRAAGFRRVRRGWKRFPD